jgi:hypothetical protein
LEEDIPIWILAFLVSLTLVTTILYIEPSFPLAVLGVYVIEVMMYANLFINNQRYQKSSNIPRKKEYANIFQLEKDD